MTDDSVRSHRPRILGALAIAFFVAHLLWHVYLGDPQNALWACHIASLLIGFGGLFGNTTLIVIGLMWLVVGIPLWIYHLVAGGPFVPTSLFTHFGAAIIGCTLLSMMRLGRPIKTQMPSIWWRACLAVATLVAITRLITHRSDNINLAFDVHGRSDSSTGEHAQYLLILAAVVSIVFFLSELVFRKVFSPPCDTS